MCEFFLSLSLSRLPASVVNQAGLGIFVTRAHQKRDVVSGHTHTLFNTHTERLIARRGLFSSCLTYKTRPNTLIFETESYNKSQKDKSLCIYMMNGRAPCNHHLYNTSGKYCHCAFVCLGAHDHVTSTNKTVLAC